MAMGTLPRTLGLSTDDGHGCNAQTGAERRAIIADVYIFGCEPRLWRLSHPVGIRKSYCFLQQMESQDTESQRHCPDTTQQVRDHQR